MISDNNDIIVIDGIVSSGVHHKDNKAEFIVKSGVQQMEVHVYNNLSDMCSRFLDIGSHVLISGMRINDTSMQGREVRFLPKKSTWHLSIYRV